MNAVKEVSLTVNEKNLVNGLKHAFTTKTTLYKEILQNSDRAGARHVLIWLEESSDGALDAVIEDDGCGIEDIGLLLSIAVSGWSDEVMLERSPYGLGFLSALYATSRIEVESRGFRASFESAAALGFQPVLIERHKESHGKPGTRLVLHGLKLQMSEAASAIRSFAYGFPVRVFVNGEEAQRPHAVTEPGRQFIQTSIGLVSMPALETGDTRLGTILYLQGFKVYNNRNYGNLEGCAVVHLDPKRFIARMPDRDVLEDQADRIKEVDKVIDELWRQTLARKRQELPAAEFLDRYHQAINTYARDMMNDLPLLSRHVVERFTDMPFQTHDWDSFSAHPEAHVPMEDVLSGKVLLVDIEDMSDEAAISAWNYAWAKKKALIIGPYALHDGHWAKPYIRRIDETKTEVEVNGQYAEGGATGSWIWGMNVALCDSFTIRVSDEEGAWQDSVRIDDEIMSDGQAFLVPRKAEPSGWAVRQLSDYMSDERFDEEAMDADEELLLRKIRELRGMAPAEILESVLASANVFLRDYPSLKGRSFVIEVDADGSYQVAEQASQ